MAAVKTLDAKQMRDLGFYTRTAMQAVPPKGQEPRTEARKKTPGAVTKIEAVKTEKAKLKVAAYCRVSTQLESQQTSISSQYRHYASLIKANTDWELAGIYLEAGISGTKAEIRPQLQKMLQAAREKRIDLILTKSISRFSRDTSDCLEMVRTLTSLGVNIRFEKERIDTGTMGSEFMLSILACLAQDESASISSNMKWGIRKRFEAGTYRQSKLPYGYDEGFVINEEQAEVVKRIFSDYVSGKGTDTIAEELNDARIPTMTGVPWNAITLRQMLQNVSYTGDRLMQKTYMENYRQMANTGELDQYYEEGHHDAIIPMELFETAQKVRERNCGENARSTGRRYAFSGKLVCGCCGATMYRMPGKHHDDYLCHTCMRDENSKNRELEESIQNAFTTCMNRLKFSQEKASHALVGRYITGVQEKEQKLHEERISRIYEALEQNRIETESLHAATIIDFMRKEDMAKKAALMHEEQELRKELEHLTAWTPMAGKAEALKDILTCWDGRFSGETFTAVIDHAVVTAGKEVTFFFSCGLIFTESLADRPEPILGGREPECFTAKGCRMPYGYRMENGEVKTDAEAAERLRTFFSLYLGGASVKAAGEGADIPLSASSCRNILRNRIYEGNGSFSQIISPDTFDAVKAEMERRKRDVRGTGQRIIQPVRIRSRFVIRKTKRTASSPEALAKEMYEEIKNADSGDHLSGVF